MSGLNGAGRKPKLWKNIATLIVLGLAVHLVLPQIATLEKSLKVLSTMRYWAIGLAIVAQLLSYVGSGFLVQKTLHLFKQEVSLYRGILIILGSTSIAMAGGGPVGSSAAIFTWTSGKKGRIGGAALASLFPSLFISLALIVFSIFGLVNLIISHHLTQFQLVGFSITLLFLTLAICASVLASRYQNRTEKIFLWIAEHYAKIRHKSYDPVPVKDEIESIFAAWDELWNRKWHLLALGAFINVMFDMLTLYFMFVAAGAIIRFDVLLSGYALPLLLGRMVIILPGGVGIVESGMDALYSTLGIASATSVIAILGYRLISFWIPIIAGFPIAAYLNRTSIRDSNHLPDGAE